MLIWIACAFGFGIFLGDWVEMGVVSSLLVALAAAGALSFARVVDRFTGVTSLFLALALGLSAQSARPRAPPALVDGLPWGVEGEVVRDPERAFGKTRIVVDVIALERGERRREASGRVSVTLNGDPVEPLLPGDRVRFVAPLHLPRGFANPGAPDALRRAAADEVVANTGLHDPAALARLAVPVAGSLQRTVSVWRACLEARINRALEGEPRALTASLVVGDRGDLLRPLDDAFRIAGVSHVLSVSGLHLAVAAFLFYTGLTRLLLRVPRLGRGRSVRRWAAAASLPAVVVYTLLTGAQVATVRACVVALVYLSALALDRRTTAAGALALAALAVLWSSPLELFDPSFQLSFAAALGTAFLTVKLPEMNGFLAWGLRLIVASAAAILATLPIGALHFSQISPMGLLSNLVIVPLAELVVVPVGLAGAVLNSGICLKLAALGCWLMAAFVRWFASWAPSWRVAAPSAFEIAAWYAALLLSCRRRWRPAAICLALAVLSFGGRAGLRRVSTTLEATFLDVGQGDSCVIELPRGKVMVIDGGGSFDPAFDPGQQVIAPFLWRRGIRRIDLLVLSHPHPDHANGLPFLVENFAIGEIWTNGQESPLPALARLQPRASPRPRTLAGVEIRPLGGIEPNPDWSENDNSLVLELGYAGRKLLFTGDIEREAEARLPLSRVDLVKVPHHGSRTSSTDELVGATQPVLAVISVGERNRWGFPSPSVVARWQEVGARVLRTDRDGAVTVRVRRGGRMEVETMR